MRSRDAQEEEVPADALGDEYTTISTTLDMQNCATQSERHLSCSASLNDTEAEDREHESYEHDFKCALAHW